MTDTETRTALDTAAWGGRHVHDPTVVRDGDGTYWLFSTDARYDGPVRGGVPIRRSRDLVTWELVGWALPGVPGPAADWSGAEGLWAPEVVEVTLRDGTRGWRMYYSASSFGSRRSAIGLATAPHPSGPWADHGIVVASDHVEPPEGLGHPNAIDANVVTEADGSQWLVYGSFFGGVHVLPLDPATGLLASDVADVSGRPGALRDAPGRCLARRPRAADGAVEGAFVLPRPGGGWALLVSYDSLAGSYHLRAAVADRVTGPYRDRGGLDLADLDAAAADPWAVGVPVLSGHRLAGGRGLLGPGHASVLTEPAPGAPGVRQLLVHHVRDADAPTEHRVQVRRLVWTHDGWPLVSPQPWAGTGREQDDESRWPTDPTVLDGPWESFAPGADATHVQDGVIGPLPRRADVRVVAPGRFAWLADDGAHVSAVVHPGWDAVRGRATLCLSTLDDRGRTLLATRLPRPAPETAPEGDRP
ncbi:arabinan endo-1,5-alpha-L-arabinosidase [Isoptericola sp. NEAU-Y5]|uniref:Arabinan endo-1,5-alpha-L-arabinosidase n=1 Tax=Isoptericola luteus TaxID=2879484 RepID=A0ABS7ZFY4_9MICO|nr:arabinan endo-1,5-alpha-L-arabinosidase [Isoptericola sp. NEAU-Y5]MCA5892509.1 arabinan endo-1,5-alpha-L-arabinosidase [Isoptericola sp. NEAU-Y5]